MDLDEFRRKLAEIAARGEARAADSEYQARAAVIANELDEAAARERRAVRRNLGIPVAIQELLEAPAETEALQKAREFLGSAKRLLLLAGDVGRGKSVAAAWAVDQRHGRFIEAADVVQANIYDAEGWRRFMAPGLLAVDELGMEPLDQNGWGESKFYDLLNGRIQDGKQTILCTNLAPARFIARYPDPRLRDRLNAYGAVLIAKGPSMRGGKP